MKTLQITIIVVLTISTILTTGVFAQKTGAIALVFLNPDKEIYFPGDSIFIHGQDNMNVTSITIGLEKNHNVMVSSEDSQVLKNGTFYANFTLPRDSDAKYWSLVSGPLHQDLYFKPVYLSPLEQFREGIEPSKTRCKGSLDLVISHDNLPACVKPGTAQKLVERGWTSVLTIDLGTNVMPNHAVEIVSIHMVPSLINPGGPPIQLTLKNIGMTQITSINVVLRLNNDYTFDFKNITSSKPLASGNSASETKILIGGGFDTDLTYPIIITGIVNNIQFSYTENVHISSR